MQQCAEHFEICTDFVEQQENGIYQYKEPHLPPDYSKTLAIGTIRSTANIDQGLPPVASVYSYWIKARTVLLLLEFAVAVTR